MTDRIRPARVARTLRQAATGGLVFAFLMSIVGPAAVMASEGATGVNDNYSVAKNVQLVKSTDDGVLSNDDLASYADLVASPDHGFLDLHTNGSFTYDPDAGFVGTDVFTYLACVAPGDCNPTPVTVTITVSNSAPVAVDDAATVLEDSTANTIDAMLNDTDANGDSFQFAALHQPLNGLVTVVGSGSSASFRYTPDANFFGTDTFTYSVKDSGLTSALGTVTVTVTGVNDAPSFSNGGNITRTEDSAAYSAAWATSVSPGQNEEDSTSFVVTNNNNPLFSTQPAISGSGVLSFTLSPNANGSATVQATIHDNGGTANDGISTGNTVSFTITVSAVNDAPVCGNDTVSLNEDGATTGNLGTVCSDVDNNPTYSGGPATHGVVVVGSNGAWSYTADANYFGSDSFGFTAIDSSEASGTGTVNITVNSINDAPTFTLGANVVENEDAGLKAYNGFLTSLSAGPANESGQTVSLLVTNDNNALFSVQPTIVSGRLCFTTALNAHGVATVTVTATDNGGTNNTTTHTFTITLDAVNDAPVGVANAYSVNEDNVLTVNALNGVITNDTDVDLNSLTVFSNTAASSGTVVVASNGSFTYTPLANFNGTATFTYIATDGSLNTSATTVTITINAVNDAPVGVADAYTIAEDGVLTVAAINGVMSNDSDIDSAFHIVATNPAAHGSVSVDFSNGSFTYTPAANYYGPDTFKYYLSDTLLGSGPFTVTITVTPVEDPVTAVADAKTVLEDTATDIYVLGNDIDPDIQAIRVSSVGSASHGTVTIPVGGQNVRYTPSPDYNGMDSFTYSVTDDHGSTTTATVTVTVTSVNDAPTFTVAANLVVNEDSGPHAAGILTAFSTGPADESEQSNSIVLTNDNNGLFLVQPSWNSETDTVDYTTALNANGVVTVTVTVTDNGGTSSGGDDSTTKTFTITITPVNDAPVGVANAYSTNEDNALTVDALNGVITNDTDVDIDPESEDVDLDPLTVLSNTAASSGTVVVASDGSFTYTPVANFNGTATFTYIATDGSLNTSATTVTITVDAVNDAPVGVANAYSVNEDNVLTVNALNGVITNDTDVDLDSLTVASITAASSGTVVVASDGSFTYTPVANFNGTATFTYIATDGLLNSAATTVTITVDAVNDAPVGVANAYSVNEDNVLTVNALNGVITNDTDVDLDTLTVLSNTAATSGSVVLASDGSFTYTPVANFNGTATFTYIATDDSLNTSATTVTITVNAVNDAPVAVSDTGSMAENASATSFDVLDNDTDVEHETLLLTNASVMFTAGTVAVVSGEVRFTPAALFSGSAVITYTVSDQHAGTPGTSTGTLTVTVDPDITAPVAIAPVVTIGAGTVTSRTPFKVTWSATDAGVGVTSMHVQVSMDGGTWTEFYTGTGTTMTAYLLKSHSYRFRLAATDAEGNVSAFVTSESRLSVMVQALSSAITYKSAAWTMVRPTVGQGYMYSSKIGYSASHTFVGREIVWVAPKSSASGKAYVYIDGVKVATVTLYRSSSLAGQQIYKKVFSGYGKHTIKIVVVTAGKRIALDEFIVLK